MSNKNWKELAEKLAKALEDTRDLALQVPALQPGGWEDEVIETANAVLIEFEAAREKSKEINTDLLDACKAIVREYDAETASYDFPTPDDFADFCFEQAQAAIAKAEGTDA